MRNIAILRDGLSDFYVIRKFLQSIFKKHRKEELPDNCFIDLDQLNIFNSLSRYLHNTSNSSNYSFTSDDSNKLLKDLIAIYYACYQKTLRVNSAISNKEIIIINSDTEKLLKDRSNYFTEWAYSINRLIYFSIEKFYEEMVKQGYNYEILPYFIPLILFPSSEILVASCIFDISKENIRYLHPTPQLKKKVYDTESIPEAFRSGKLFKTINTYLTEDNINNVYKEIPEARLLIHTLTN
ncbi:MAG: hypothetical protein HYY40_09520 [Bacteroidetes bacterium]|nr:hypothetical protein [Bacteroidota bacterium]